MVYSIWGRPKKQEVVRGFADKAFSRKNLASWDAKWHALSTAARLAFLDDVKGPVKPMIQGRPVTPPTITAGKVPPPVLAELIAGGFVQDPGLAMKSGTAVVKAGLYDFVTRVRALRRFQLLDPERPSSLAKFLEYTCYANEATVAFGEVLHQAGIDALIPFNDLALRYMVTHRWPGWTVRTLKKSLAGPIVDAIRLAGASVPITQALEPVLAPEVDARPVLDELISYLALVEDLDPATLDIKVGLLPVVLDDWEKAEAPRQRPPLVPTQAIREFGPEDAPVVDDLRGFLLEVAGEPPQVRQDHDLFAKEMDRFLAGLTPQPTWLTELMGFKPEQRVDEALAWAWDLDLIEELPDGKRARLHLTAKGKAWLASGVEEQHAAIYKYLAGPKPLQGDPEFTNLSRFMTQFGGSDELDPFRGFGGEPPGDAGFFGISIAALKVTPGRRPSPWNLKLADLQPLRAAVDRALSALPLDVYHGAANLLDHLIFGNANPLRLGAALDQVAVYWAGRPVPPLEDQREEAGRLMLGGFLESRLVPLGVMRVSVAGDGKLCLARTPRLDAYFGRKPAAPSRAEAAAIAAATQVIVQPDFSIMVIGPNPAPAAELAPFCERTTRGGGPGAQILKLTRDSVVKAVAHGLKPEEIAARLRRLATKDIPPNVLKEVEGWSAWVRRVEPSTLTVLRCPDHETADRVLSALRKRAERVNDTLIAIDEVKLSTADRLKLRDHGILVGPGTPTAGKTKVKVKAKKISRPY